MVQIAQYQQLFLGLSVMFLFPPSYSSLQVFVSGGFVFKVMFLYFPLEITLTVLWRDFELRNVWVQMFPIIKSFVRISDIWCKLWFCMEKTYKETENCYSPSWIDDQFSFNSLSLPRVFINQSWVNFLPSSDTDSEKSASCFWFGPCSSAPKLNNIFQGPQSWLLQSICACVMPSKWWYVYQQFQD